jgi:hypothetical protein
MALGSTEPLTEMNVPGDKGQPARKTGNLTAVCEPIFYKIGNLDVSQPIVSSQPVTAIILLSP